MSGHQMPYKQGMKLGSAMGAVLGLTLVNCQDAARDLSTAAGGEGGAASTNTAGAAGTNNALGGGAGHSSASQAGSAGANQSDAGSTSDASEAGAAGSGSEPPDSCKGMLCDSPPTTECKDATTITHYAASGTCSDNGCDYASTDTPCSGDTPKCQSSNAQCVTCLVDTDCQNGGTCSASNACVCSARFNGKHCEFQVFHPLGTLPGDLLSYPTALNHDGSVVAGISQSASYVYRAFRSVNGAALEAIPNPPDASSSTLCRPKAVDSSGAVLLDCDGESYLYTSGAGTMPISLPSGGYVSDFSFDGKVLVGNVSSQAFRRVGSTDSLFDDEGSFFATNDDGSVAVGGAVLWSAKTGFINLSKPSGVTNYVATDVSGDGKVVVGTGDPALNGVPFKWSGPALTPSALSAYGQAFATNSDGSVTVGDSGPDSQEAMIWDATGAHKLLDVITATGTPDISGWNFSSAVGVSDDGKVVVGSGSLTQVVWIAHLP